MTADTFNTGAEPSAEEPNPMMTPEAYHQLLTQLATSGEGVGKTESVSAYLVPDITIVTETSEGEVETSRDIAVAFQAGKKQKAYIILDPNHYPLERTRQQVVEDMARNWGQKIIHERDLDSPDFKGPGIWVNKDSAVEFDYRPDESSQAGDVWEPNPEATRIVLATDSPINIPVTWDGGFTVETGGVIAIRERDMADLVEALAAIENGDASVEEALYSEPGVAKFDVYGMEPGFCEDNYNAVEVKPETQQLQARLSSSSGTGQRPGRRPQM